MRVLVVVHGFPPQSQGGSEIYADEHARTLARVCRDEVQVLTREADPARPEYDVRHEERDGLKIAWINNTFGSVRSFEESYRNPRIAAIAETLVDACRPEVAHLHHLTCLSTGIVSALAARRIPSVLTLHDYWLMCHRGQLLNLRYERCEGPGVSACDACIGSADAPPIPAAVAGLARGIDRRLPPVVRQAGRQLVTALAPQRSGDQTEAGRRLDHMRAICDEVSQFVAPSRSIRQRFVEFGIAPERITWSPYGLDHARFPPVTHTPARPLRLGFLGTLMASKAPHLLLEAHRLLPDGAATVTLCGALADYHGDASYRRLLEPLLARPGVRMMGTLPHDQIPKVLASLDVLVVPSIWEENSPFVIWEAMLGGVPVVATRIGGISEIVEDGRNGLLFEPGDVDGLARTLQRLIDEPRLLDQLRAGAIATHVRTIEDDVRRTREVYASLISHRAHPARPRQRLASIVLNHRTVEDTLLAVASQLASNREPDEVIVVDNDVADECRAPLARYAGRIRYLHTGRNLGFAGGTNVGIREALEAGCDQILLMNADVVIPPDCIGRLQEALARDGTGIVGPVVRSRSFPDVIGSAGIDYNARTGRMRHRAYGARVGAGESGRAQLDADGLRDAVSGCAMLISREVFERIGLFDERYFFSFEEIDFCLRARQAGFETRIVASASAYHAGSRAIGPASTRRFYFAARNHLLLASQVASSEPPWTRRRIAGWVVALNIAHATRAHGGSLSGRLAATARGIRDHLAGRYGSDAPGGDSL